MKREDLFDSLTDLRDDQIAEGEKPLQKRRRPKRMLWLGGIAAALALVVLTGVVVLPRHPKAPDPTLASTEQPTEAGTESRAKPTSQPPKPTDAPPPTEAPHQADGFETASDQIERAEGTIRLYQLSAPVYPKFAVHPAEAQSLGSAALAPFLAETLPAILGETAGENRLYAPINVYLALSMLTEVTDGTTRQELLDLLSAKDTAALRETGKTLWQASYSDYPDGLTSVPAASIWLRNGTAYKQDTLDTLASDYYASSYSGEMGSADYDRAIQTWINAHTGNLLQDRAAGIQTYDDTLAVLLTTIYFKAGWMESFFAANTTGRTFHSPNGDGMTDFLHGGLETDGWTENGFTAIGKPLQGGTTMYFLLPDKGTSPEELMQSADALAFLGSAEGREALPHRPFLVDFSVPKFDVDSSLNLHQTLDALGVRKVFDPDDADFSPLLAEDAPCCLREIVHAVRVKIDEKGCEAAAFMAAVPTATERRDPERLTLTLDRPFVFAIANPDGLPLFIGVVNQPNG